MTKPADQKFKFTDWYEKNKDDLNAKRKKKYESDPEYRQKAKDNARRYRLSKVKGGVNFVSTRAVPPPGKLNLSGLCQAAGIPEDTYSRYRRLGWIPKIKKNTWFTGAHAVALSALAQKALESRYMKIGRAGFLAPYIAQVANAWEYTE